MKTKNQFPLLVLILFSFSWTYAADPAIAGSHSLELKAFKGQTFLQAMIAEDGIKTQLDADYTDTYTIASWGKVQKTLKHFDPKISKKVINSFSAGIDDLKTVVAALQGTEFQPEQLIELVKPNLPAKADVYAISQLLAFASGAGTLIVLDENNYYYNYGYKSGANPDDDVKSGRSFGAGPEHNANDASDVFYLNELEKYLTETSEMKPFYEALLKILIKCDPSGLKKLSPLGQTVLTDFVAIYTAESDRHLMVELNPNKHPWEIDLAGTTLVSAFAVKVGKIMKEGTLTEGHAREWWAMSSLGNGRSGIGETRKDRRALQKMISNYLLENAKDKTDAIQSVLGERRDQDLIQGLLEFLNSYDTQDAVVANADQIIHLFSELISQTAKESTEIENQIDQLSNL